jgi:Zn-dependent peptidase ImmA (M78 family)
LAEHLAIPVIPLSDLTECVSSDSLAHFVSVEPEKFSGTTIHRGYARLVLFNDSHTEARCHSTIAHELSHALLGHPPHTLCDGEGNRNRNAVIEDEASWLAGVLLIPKPAAMRIAIYKTPSTLAAQRYMVSEEMLTYRLRVTGATKVAARCKTRSLKS